MIAQLEAHSLVLQPLVVPSLVGSPMLCAGADHALLWEDIGAMLVRDNKEGLI